MKKLICILTVLTLCAALVVPAMAEFTPSVSEKPAPEIVPVPDGEGGDGIAIILDEDGNIVEYVYTGCLIVTPVSEVNTSTEIPEESRALLLEVYNKLRSGATVIPYDQFNAGLDPDKMVIRDLFDATFICREHPEMLIEDGINMRITFDLGIAAGEDVYVSAYVDGQWEPIVDTVNNGDGTITCLFDQLCPIAFSVEGAVTPPAGTGDPAGENLTLWFVLGGAALVALVALAVVYKINSKKAGK